MEFDIESEWRNSEYKNCIDFIKVYCKNNPAKKKKIQKYLDNDISFVALEDSLINGHAKHWQDDLGIHDIEDKIEGGEVIAAFKTFCKLTGFDHGLY